MSGAVFVIVFAAAMSGAVLFIVFAAAMSGAELVTELPEAIGAEVPVEDED